MTRWVLLLVGFVAGAAAAIVVGALSQTELGPQLVLTTTLALANVLLVGVTLWYAKSTSGMLKEMRVARAAQLLPKVLVTIWHRPAGHGFLRLLNAGAGPAFDVKVELTLEPNGPSRSWSAKLVTPGESHDFVPSPEEEPNGLLGLNDLTSRYTHVRLSGSCRNALGDEHPIEEQMEIRDYWRQMKSAEHIRPEEWPREMTKHLKEIAEQVKGLAGRLGDRR
jgi:hypothetical protein